MKKFSKCWIIDFSQDYINKFQIFKNEKIDINFDLLKTLINLLLNNTHMQLYLPVYILTLQLNLVIRNFTTQLRLRSNSKLLDIEINL